MKSTDIGAHDHSEYDNYLKDIQKTFTDNVGNSPVFTVKTDGLWEIYLASFPEAERQYHNCNACKNFIRKFGGLVTIDDSGLSSSAVWDIGTAPESYLPAIIAMSKFVNKSTVSGVFFSSENIWGLPTTGEWTHFSLTPPVSLIYRGYILSAGQFMAEKLEDFKNINLALSVFTLSTVTQALKLLKSDSMYRSEKVLGAAQWLFDLHNAINATHKNKRANIVWKFIATAPAGFCHPRSSMIGTLLDDIAEGHDFDVVAARFKDKMHPLQYQRPQAPPSSGNIEQAEKIVAALGIEPSLKRRFAKAEELETLWVPVVKSDDKGKGGVFAKVKAKNESPDNDVTGSLINMTWEKFQREVLPDALDIEFFTPRSSANYTAILTSVHADAPPILQWDTEENRNPFSWYVYNGGSPATTWGLVSGVFTKVSAVTLKPSMWGDKDGIMDHHGKGVVFVLEGAKDTRQAGLALFPETLKSELRQIRSTIEAFSRDGKLEGVEESTACGIAMMSGSEWDSVFKVKTALGDVFYKLDRWD